MSGQVITSYYDKEELESFGFICVGEDVRISKKASFYGCSNISIGSHVRIDDFCVLSGKIEIGSYIHINPFCGFFASDAGIYLRDFVNISSRVAMYAISDDYSGESMTSPLVPDEYKNIKKSPIYIDREVIIGTGSTVLPGVHIYENCAIGAMSLVKEDCMANGIYVGIPCRKIRERAQNDLELERAFLRKEQKDD